jgi:hypothetical protein
MLYTVLGVWDWKTRVNYISVFITTERLLIFRCTALLPTEKGLRRSAKITLCCELSLEMGLRRSVKITLCCELLLESENVGKVHLEVDACLAPEAERVIVAQDSFPHPVPPFRILIAEKHAIRLIPHECTVADLPLPTNRIKPDLGVNPSD